MKNKHILIFIVLTFIFLSYISVSTAAEQPVVQQEQAQVSEEKPASQEQPSVQEDNTISEKEYPVSALPQSSKSQSSKSQSSKSQTSKSQPAGKEHIAYDIELPYNYTVHKGDTLWNISQKLFHSKFLWPMIWQENPDIKNPDDIHPGQIIKIPLIEGTQNSYNMPISPEAIKEAVEKNKIEQTTDKEDKIEQKRAVKERIFPKVRSTINELSLILQGGYIAKELKAYGRTLTTPEGRKFIGTNDFVYVKTDSDEHQTYYIMRSEKRIIHPKTGKYLGDMINFEGTLKIIGKEAGFKKAIVLSSFNEIFTDDILVPFFTIEPASVISEKPFINGMIIYTKHTHYTAQFDIVYTDKGSTDGVTAGDIFTVYTSDEPRQPIGKIKIISSQRNTSTAYVIKCSKEMGVGSIF